MTEPPKCNSIDRLEPYVRERVVQLLRAMKARGFEPQVFETFRTQERQRWLWGQGRSPLLCRIRLGDAKYSHPGKIVTKTLRSRHLVGKAADIIDWKKKWDNPKFFEALREEAAKVGLKTLKFEACHVEW